MTAYYPITVNGTYTTEPISVEEYFNRLGTYEIKITDSRRLDNVKTLWINGRKAADLFETKKAQMTELVSMGII